MEWMPALLSDFIMACSHTTLPRAVILSEFINYQGQTRSVMNGIPLRRCQFTLWVSNEPLTQCCIFRFSCLSHKTGVKVLITCDDQRSHRTFFWAWGCLIPYWAIDLFLPKISSVVLIYRLYLLLILSYVIILRWMHISKSCIKSWQLFVIVLVFYCRFGHVEEMVVSKLKLTYDWLWPKSMQHK